MKTLRWIGFSASLTILAMLACAKSQSVADLAGLTTGQPGINSYEDGEPGETSVLKRPYRSAPPLVPHSVEGLTVTRTTNDCLDCHLDGDLLDDGHIATKVSSSHFINKYTGVESSGTVSGNRYLCLQCHVPQTRAAPK